MAAFDESERGACGVVGCAFGGSASAAAASVEEEHGVPVGGCLYRCGE